MQDICRKESTMEETYMEMLTRRAKNAATEAAKLGTAEKNRGLLSVADELISQQEMILAENEKDLAAAREKGIKQSLIDRLALSEKRIADMAEGLRQIAGLDDPIGEVLYMKTRPNGLRIGQKRVPLGVVGIIYESRPNVTADAFGLCFKTGNAVILRGGSDAIHSNQAIVRAIKTGLRKERLCQDLVVLVEDTSRDVVNDMMKMHGGIDVLIPRGGAGLIANVVENSTVPVIETGTGNCHVYVDETADIRMAADIVENAKTQRMGVCNACESLVVHSGIAEAALPQIVQKLKNHDVEIRGDEPVRSGDQLVFLHLIPGFHNRLRRFADAFGDDHGITVEQRRLPHRAARTQTLSVGGGMNSPIEPHDIAGTLAHFSALHSGSCFSMRRCSSAESNAPVGQPAACTSS